MKLTHHHHHHHHHILIIALIITIMIIIASSSSSHPAHILTIIFPSSSLLMSCNLASVLFGQGAHDGAELFRGDGAIPVLVEERERLFELRNLLLRIG